jgi:hypothetical protein
MARLTRMAHQASESWWSRICRWQVGMILGWSLWFWILGVPIYGQALCGWIFPKAPRPLALMMGMTSLVSTLVPAFLAAVGVLQWRTSTLRYESLLPVDRRSYLRQVGTAAAVGHFRLWAGMSVALALWWLLIDPRPLPLARLGGVLAFSAAFQVGVFGVVVWVARYPSRAPAGFAGIVMSAFFSGVLSFQVGWSKSSPEHLPHVALWVAGVIAVIGLAITYDAYRRWLVTDFD